MKLFPKMKVKKVYLCYLLILLIIMGILLIIVLYGKQNSSKDGNILAGASPDTSAFQFYYFDGKAVTLRTLYDPAMEKELIKKINALPMEIADKDAISTPLGVYRGAVLSGEDSLGGALREVNEELGIILNPKDGKRISRICREQTRDLYDVWVFYKDVDISDITLQETEVVDVKWVTDEELIKMERKGELHPLLALTM
ncbi:NUDIX domain-containing protein [Hungatella hathewayi]|uniref:NTP pyrophosphohydrolases including oxidative damage repair enzymes n=1 Tax=Hungatella hathewayi TaxID=154046 RepID=A0A174BXE5_9FIRM|nr:NUDIX domain-containing protein [Hungatella hathewayi]CUO05297.1 NTP pyrophosphohydrolases including oxidative damage repair enzymes [Hungatella hathewayi]